MASTSAAAAKRSRASTEQLLALLDFTTDHQGLATGKFQRLHGKLGNKRKWAEMADKLNAIGRANKSVEQSRTVWRDLKSRTSTKVRNRKRQQALTGNRPIEQAPLSEVDMRVVALIGGSYVEGHEEAADNVPFEEEFQLIMEDGESIDFGEIPAAQFYAVSEVKTCTPKTPRQTPRRALKRKRAEDESDAEKKFQQIAEKQADALKMMAESNNRQEEATLAMAQAITVVGEGLKALAETFNRLSS